MGSLLDCLSCGYAFDSFQNSQRKGACRQHSNANVCGYKMVFMTECVRRAMPSSTGHAEFTGEESPILCLHLHSKRAEAQLVHKEVWVTYWLIDKKMGDGVLPNQPRIMPRVPCSPGPSEPMPRSSQACGHMRWRPDSFCSPALLLYLRAS